MQTRTKLALLELSGGLVGWGWIGASLAATYFFFAALFFSGSWKSFFWAVGVSVVCKWLTRGFMESKNRVADEAGPTSRGESEVESLVRSYGIALEDAVGSIAVDAGRLPAPKDKIKAVLIAALRATKDSEMRENLKLAYLELSTFQLGVGSSPVEFGVSTALDENDPEAIRAAAQSIFERGPAVQRWSTITSEERELLVGELERARF